MQGAGVVSLRKREGGARSLVSVSEGGGDHSHAGSEDDKANEWCGGVVQRGEGVRHTPASTA